MSQTVRDPLWMFEVHDEWILEIYEDHMRHIDYYEDVVEISFGVGWV